jgi:hypothetical protein
VYYIFVLQSDSFMAFSIRLDPQTEAAIARLARQGRRTKSAVVREAIAVYQRTQTSAGGQPQTVFEAMAPFIGNRGQRWFAPIRKHRRGVPRANRRKGPCTPFSLTQGRLSRSSIEVMHTTASASRRSDASEIRLSPSGRR